jgi:hypothetical protein
MRIGSIYVSPVCREAFFVVTTHRPSFNRIRLTGSLSLPAKASGTLTVSGHLHLAQFANEYNVD